MFCFCFLCFMNKTFSSCPHRNGAFLLPIIHSMLTGLPLRAEQTSSQSISESGTPLPPYGAHTDGDESLLRSV